MKKLLFVTSHLSFDDSSASIRNRVLTEGLSTYFDVSILEIVRVRDKKRVWSPTFPVKNTFEIESIKNSESITLGKKSFLSVILSKIQSKVVEHVPDKLFFKSIDIRSKVPLSEFDYVMSSSDPKGIHKLVIDNINVCPNIKLIQYWGDPLYDDVFGNQSKIRYLLEKWLLSKADLVLYNSPATVQRQLELFEGLRSKTHVLYRGLSRNSTVADKRPINEDHSKLQLLYAGDFHSHVRNLKPLHDACRELNHQLSIFGAGSLGFSYDTNTLRLSERVSQKRIAKESENSDVLVVVLNKKGGQIPGKIFDVMLSNRPVLLVTDGDIKAKDLPSFPLVVSCDNDKNSICGALKFIHSNYNQFVDPDLSAYYIDSLVKELIKEFKL